MVQVRLWWCVCFRLVRRCWIVTHTSCGSLPSFPGHLVRKSASTGVLLWISPSSRKLEESWISKSLRVRLSKTLIFLVAAVPARSGLGHRQECFLAFLIETSYMALAGMRVMFRTQLYNQSLLGLWTCPWIGLLSEKQAQWQWGTWDSTSFLLAVIQGSFHVKSTQKIPYPHRFERNLVFTRCLLRY